MDPFTRRIIGFGVHAGDVDGIALCRMFARAIAGKGEPRYLSSDHDPLFEYYRWKANLRVTEISEVSTVPHVPQSHPFVERLIGKIHREYLDYVSFWKPADLEKKLKEFGDYYKPRVQSSLDGQTPAEISEQRINVRAVFRRFQWQAHRHGLYALPVAARSAIRQEHPHVSSFSAPSSSGSALCRKK